MKENEVRQTGFLPLQITSVILTHFNTCLCRYVTGFHAQCLQPSHLLPIAIFLWYIFPSIRSVGTMACQTPGGCDGLRDPFFFIFELILHTWLRNSMEICVKENIVFGPESSTSEGRKFSCYRLYLSFGKFAQYNVLGRGREGEE